MVNQPFFTHLLVRWFCIIRYTSIEWGWFPSIFSLFSSISAKSPWKSWIYTTINALIDIPLNPHMFLVFFAVKYIYVLCMYIYIYVCVSISLLLKWFIIIVPIQLPKLGSLSRTCGPIFPRRILRQSNMVVRKSFIYRWLSCYKPPFTRICYFPFEGINMNYP